MATGKGSEHVGGGGMDYRWQAAKVLKLRQQSSITDVINAIHRGFAYGAVETLSETYRVPLQMLEDAIGISPSTLSRRKKGGRFNEPESDRILRVAGLYAMAENIIGDRGLAIDWMHTPNRGLGGNTPITYAKTEAGAREVEDLLGRVAHGVVA